MADPAKITRNVVTRERKIIDVVVDEVTLPAADGEIGVLPGHTPLLATLRIGQLRYRTGNSVHRLVISWGFAEVLPDRVIVLAERGFLPNEVWRLLGLVLARDHTTISESSFSPRAVATAVLAGVIAKLILFPSGSLAGIPLSVRVGAAAIGLAAFLIVKRSAFAGVLAGEAALLLGGFLLVP